jgi:hypothetical protein
MTRRLLLIPACLYLVTGWAAPAYCQPVDAVLTQGRAWCNSFDEFCDHPNTGRPYLFTDGCLDADLTHIQIGGPRQSYNPRYVTDAWSTPTGLWDSRLETQWGPAGVLEAVSVTLYHIPTPEDPEINRIVGRWTMTDVLPITYGQYRLRETLKPDGITYPGAGEFTAAYGFTPAVADLRVFAAQINTTMLIPIDGRDHGAVVTLSAYIHPAGKVTDIDENGVVDTSDLFAFLSLWFAYDDFTANWDGQDNVQTEDLFAFLSEWQEERE